MVEQHQRTLDRLSVVAQSILDSDATCANELSNLVGGPSYTAPVIPRRGPFGSSDQVANGFSVVQHYLGTDEPLPDLPWGPAVSIRFPGKLSAVQGFASAAVGALQGAYVLFGSKDEAQKLQAWQGMFALGAAALTTKAVFDRGGRDLSAEDARAMITVADAAKITGRRRCARRRCWPV